MREWLCLVQQTFRHHKQMFYLILIALFHVPEKVFSTHSSPM